MATSDEAKALMESSLLSLTSMGFPASAAQTALRESNGDLEKALLKLTSADGGTGATDSKEEATKASGEASTGADVGAMEVDSGSAVASSVATVEVDAGSSAAVSAAAATTASIAAAATDIKAGSENDSSEPPVFRSFRCVETGRLFRTEADVQLYAERTGRTEFEQSTEEVKARTKEEIQAKKIELEKKIEEKRKRRAREEKEAAKAAEIAFVSLSFPFLSFPFLSFVSGCLTRSRTNHASS